MQKVTGAGGIPVVTLALQIEKHHRLRGHNMWEELEPQLKKR